MISREKPKGQAGDPPVPVYIYTPTHAKNTKLRCKLQCGRYLIGMT